MLRNLFAFFFFVVTPTVYWYGDNFALRCMARIKYNVTKKYAENLFKKKLSFYKLNVNGSCRTCISSSRVHCVYSFVFCEGDLGSRMPNPLIWCWSWFWHIQIHMKSKWKYESSTKTFALDATNLYAFRIIRQWISVPDWDFLLCVAAGLLMSHCSLYLSLFYSYFDVIYYLEQFSENWLKC